MSKIANEVYQQIGRITGEDRVKIDDFERRMYSHDLASLPKIMELGFKMMPDLVVIPKDAKEIAEIVMIAVKEGIPIVPRGGASWGLGGAMPVEGGIVIDLTRMNKILDIDEENNLVTLESGMTWKMLHETLLKNGFMLGSYPSSAYAATIGGWINTGGVGVGSYKYGAAIDHIQSMEVVLPNGGILATGNGGMIGTGSFDLNRLFFGSEGTLGIITQVKMKMYPGPEELRPLSYGFSDLKALSKATSAITRSQVEPLHVSFLDKNHFDFLRDIGMGGDTPEVGAMLNVTLEGDTEVLNAEEALLDSISAEHGGEKQTRDTAEHEWSERFYELRTKRAGPSAVLGEAFVPMASMADMASDIYKLIKKMKLRAAITGMVGDRNTVVFMPYYLSDERKMIRSMVSLSFVKKLGDLAFANGGRPAGLGLFFTGNLKKMYGPGLDVMHDLKAVLDPHDVMNPGKTTEGLTRFGVPIPAFTMNLGMNVMARIKHMMSKDKGVPA
jgi:glycolate oxidase